MTDNGSNFVKAATEMRMEREPCMAHFVHNLLTRDAIGNTPEIVDVIRKCREIYTIFRSKASLFKEQQQKRLCHLSG